jgi:hypothetical protein
VLSLIVFKKKIGSIKTRTTISQRRRDFSLFAQNTTSDNSSHYFLTMMKIALAVLTFFFLLPQKVIAFHVDPSQLRARKTFLVRDPPPSQHIRHEDQLPPEAYTDEERRWRFPEEPYVRTVLDDDDVLPRALTDQERTWRFPQRNLVRTEPTVQPYRDEERMRQPPYDYTRHQDVLPDGMDDEDRFWWGIEDSLYLEDIDEFDDPPIVQPSMEYDDSPMFRRPFSRFTRHPHSIGNDDDLGGIGTMLEDDRLTWLAENTNKFLEDDNGDMYLGTC